MSDFLTIPSADALLAVRVDGDGHKPWLVMSNSLGADMSMWDAQADHLMLHRRLARYDTRGHGRSSAPEGPYDFDRLVGDIVAIMDHLHIEEADILGLSLGGMTALGLGLTHPLRVRRLICCCARAEYPAAAIAAWDQRIAQVTAGGMTSILEDTLARWFTPKAFRERPDIIEHARQMLLSTSIEGYRGCGAALKTLDYFQDLPSLQARTLYVAGEVDGAAPAEVMRRMAEATPHGDFAVVRDAAHIANMEQAAAFNACVSNFLLEADFSDDAVSRL
jgi:3-oxoadipate enol-lactonase